ncbi:MAG: hypothetical protein R3188_06940 [Acidiferrobacterales bacterium]|nr:hypothetical protein [Acidiferrobacterales bacterium]
MNDTTAVKVHWSFWLIGVIALIWHVLGSANYLMQMNTEIVSRLPDTHRAIIEGRPAWATGGFAIAVFGGALASLLLLLRKSAAFYVFIASLLGVLVTMVHTARVAGSVIAFTGSEIFVMIILPIIVAGSFIWYSRYAERRNWIS